jgi:hypothetical protein
LKSRDAPTYLVAEENPRVPGTADTNTSIGPGDDLPSWIQQVRDQLLNGDVSTHEVVATAVRNPALYP